MGQVAPLGAITDTQGAMSKKRATGGPLSHNLNFTLDILELQIKNIKKALGVFYGSLETYSELQTKS